MILLAQAAAQASPAAVVGLFGAGAATLLYWSLSRNVTLLDAALAEKNKALGEAFDRIRALETKLAVQEAENRHLREKVQLAERIDALHACRHPQD